MQLGYFRYRAKETSPIKGELTELLKKTTNGILIENGFLLITFVP